MGIFVVSTNGNGVHFILMVGNGETIGTSEVYNSKEAAKGAIEGIKKTAAGAAVEDETVKGYKVEKNPKFVIYPDAGGKIRWRLQAGNGQIVLASQAYLSVKNALKGIASVKKNAPIGTLEEK